jgi:heterodisulfide reductase subunit D
MGVYEPPRDAIKRLPGVNFVDMERNREFQRCCGAGGNALREGLSDLTGEIAKMRVQDAKDVGAELLVTSCPCCFLTLDGGNGNGNGSNGNSNGNGAGVVVEDLATLCARSLGLI